MPARRQPPSRPNETNVDALYEAVYAKPADLARRAVLADALLQAGDPRGEFINVQLHRARTGATNGKRREQQLVKKHGSTWLGPLAKYLKAPTFESGFVAAATLTNVSFDAADARWPQWSTVTSLTAGAANPMPLLANPRLVSLRELAKLGFDDLHALVRQRGAWPISKLGLKATHAESINHLGQLHAHLPALTNLTLSPVESSMGGSYPYFSDLTAFFASKLFGALRVLSLGVDTARDVNALLERAATSKLTHLTCFLGDKGTRLAVDFAAKRVECPSDLVDDIVAPKHFDLVAGDVSKTAARLGQFWEERNFVQQFKDADEWDLVYALENGQRLTKKMKAMVEAQKTGEWTVATANEWDLSWRLAHREPLSPSLKALLAKRRR